MAIRLFVQKVLILLSALGIISNISLYAQNKLLKAEKEMPWGKVSIRTQQSVLHLGISFKQSSLDLPNQYSTDTGQSDITYSTNPEFVSHVLYIALPPSARLVQIKNKFTKGFSQQVPEVIVGYRQRNDSSLIEPIVHSISSNSYSRMIQPCIVEGYEWYRGLTLARIRVMPYINDNERVEPLKELFSDFRIEQQSIVAGKSAQKSDIHVHKVIQSLIINSEDVETLPRTQLSWNDTTGSWFSYQQQLLKLKIPDDQIYRISYEDLQTTDPAAITADPRTYRLYNRGKEIPICVQGEGDGIFGAGDFIEFVGLRNYGNRDYHQLPSATDEYPQYLNRYTDTSIYWLSWGDSTGLRIDTTSLSTAPTDTLRWYTERLHMEKDTVIQFVGGDIVVHQDPRWLAGDVWFWKYFGGPGTYNTIFQVADLEASQPLVKLTARFSSWAAQSVFPAHRVRLSVNSSDTLMKLDVAQYSHVMMETYASTSVLHNGVDTLHIHALSTNSSIQGFFFDWAEVDYPRKAIVTNDSLHFAFYDSAVTGVKAIQVTGLTTKDIVICRYAPTRKRIANCTFSIDSPFTATFIDSIEYGSKYILTSVQKVRKPFIDGIRSFSNLRNPAHGADYILITRDPLLSQAQQYATFIGSKYQFRTEVINVEDIFDEYGYGYPTAECIREFVKSSLTYWQPPMPSFLFLVGKTTYDYKYVTVDPNQASSTPNLVPSYGHPVSDIWFATPSDSSIIPNMYVGRIPASDPIEFDRYINRVQLYLNAKNDDWNKRYILFSGGDPSIIGQVESFRAANDGVISNYILPPPIAGSPTHFYKNLQSDYGPYSAYEVQQTIEQGGIFISYIGHSGTQTWDNGIVNPSQLLNTRGHYSLISDFGCSTGKFAESDVRSFSELFTVGSASSAIAYIGNTSLGFTTVATSLPLYFYKKFLHDSIYVLGEAHLLAKIERMNAFGGPGLYYPPSVNRIMMLMNTVIGDPAVEIAIPKAPNLAVESGKIRTIPSSVTEEDQDFKLVIPYQNNGTVTNDTFAVTVTHLYETRSTDTTLVQQLPLFDDTLTVNIPAYQRPGEHNITVEFNEPQQLSEIRTDDNVAQYRLAVGSNAIRPLKPLSGFTNPYSELQVLNPVRLPSSQMQNLILELDTVPSFSAPQQYIQYMGETFTKFALNIAQKNRYYYWRVRLEDISDNWTTGKFYATSDSISLWKQDDSIGFASSEMHEVEWSNRNGIVVSSREIQVTATSAGGNDGSYVILNMDGLGVLPSTFRRGHTIVVLDSTSFAVKDAQTYDTYNSYDEAVALENYINALPSGTLVVQMIADEGSQNVATNISLKNAIKTLGSILIDSVQYRDSWVLIGRKGMVSGMAREVLTRRFNGVATIDTVFQAPGQTGSIMSSEIGPVASWKELRTAADLLLGTGVTYSILGNQQNGIVDTIVYNSTDSVISLQSFSGSTYPRIKLIAILTADSSGNSPLLKKWQVEADPPIELAFNYQSVEVTPDSVLEGTPITVLARIHNLGIKRVDSVIVSLSANEISGMRELDTIFIPNISADSFYTITYNYETAGKRGSNTLFIEIDPMQKISELYKLNNIYTVPVYVATDTVGPSFDITFDGHRIYHGDYVLPHPTIKISIYDNSPMQIQNPSFVNVMLDDRRVMLGTEPDSLFETKSGPEKAVVTYRPQLRGRKDPYKLMVDVQDSTGNTVAMPEPLYFNIDTTWNIKNVFNYPNPFAVETYFTFILTDYVDNVEIKIYTINGRLIQNIQVPSQSNAYYQVYWNGRDRDGDEVANGVYFYKIIARGKGTLKEVVQKLAKVR